MPNCSSITIPPPVSSNDNLLTATSIYLWYRAGLSSEAAQLRSTAFSYRNWKQQQNGRASESICRIFRTCLVRGKSEDRAKCPDSFDFTRSIHDQHRQLDEFPELASSATKHKCQIISDNLFTLLLASLVGSHCCYMVCLQNAF